MRLDESLIEITLSLNAYVLVLIYRMEWIHIQWILFTQCDENK